MKKAYNTLHKFISEDYGQNFTKESIEGLFRSILEPVLSKEAEESYILIKINNPNENQSLLKRLMFDNKKIFGFCNQLEEFGIKNIIKDNIWDTASFLVVAGKRYCAALIWDYSLNEEPFRAKTSLLFNSKTITDIIKTITENSILTPDEKDILNKYKADRRENKELNCAISQIAYRLNEQNKDAIAAGEEKKFILQVDELYKTAEIITSRAKFTAHEIKNHLSIINLYSTICKKRLANITLPAETEESVSNAIKNIITASENISSVISELRCIASPYIEQINIKELIFSSILLCKEKADISGVIIETEQIADVTIKTDRVKLQCAIINIIYNAIEACKKGNKISINTVTDKNNLKIIIKNDGEEIPHDIREKIFEPDFTTKPQGNGLGLSICKSQLELTGGEIILLHSDKNSTAFQISLKT